KRTPDPVVTPGQLKSDQQSMLLQPESTLALDYGGSYTQNNQISVPAVHNLGYNGTGVVIAIFDSGFNRLTHEAFNSINIADTWDFVNGDADVGDGSDMGTGSHGTNTLSTVGGYAPGDLIGPAYGATYYLAKTENNESELHVEEDNWCAAAEWADTNGAQIITSSLGYTDFDTGTDYTWQDMDGDTTVVTQCADLAATKGIVVINSAGNNGYHSSNNTLGAPSDGHFVIAAGAVTSSGSRSSFSSVGLSADGRIKPDVMAMGSSVRVASANSDTGYSSVNGTSFSCPLTAGVAALVIESNPSLTATQVRDILRNTADNASSPNREYGYGILNALAAVEAATANTLNASFTHTSNLLEATFTDTSSAPTGESITGWLWNFGDGNTSTTQNPVHTYAAAGNYTVTLTVTDSASNTDSATNTVTVTDSLNYCISQGNNVNYEWVDRVDVGTFSNSSGAAGYTDFTSKVINMTIGNSYSTTLSPGFASFSYTEYWKVWIDFNRDGDFVDAGEEVFSNSGRSDVSGNIVIPAGISPGNSRMRVSMKYNGAPTPCETFSYGEVEDYTVSVGN
ncbi:MAG: S8 family serine peptidase, partial [Proteobacteria bacterium]|nr:S8 family serine peptidase [Pseudomonadota bacterium]